jgi:sugar/nucleoside kinase (ribokinase family)
MNAFRAAVFAKEAGVLVSMDGCSMQEDNELNKKLASLADVLIMNHKYPLRVSGKKTIEEALLEMATWGPKLVAATLGPAGSKAVIDGKVEHIEPYRIDPVVDSTGAGDVFHGAFIAGHLDGMAHREALRFASAAAALKCKKVGGRKGIPTKSQTHAFMNDFN